MFFSDFSLIGVDSNFSSREDRPEVADVARRGWPSGDGFAEGACQDHLEGHRRPKKRHGRRQSDRRYTSMIFCFS